MGDGGDNERSMRNRDGNVGSQGENLGRLEDSWECRKWEWKCQKLDEKLNIRREMKYKKSGEKSMRRGEYIRANE